ncbi:hypothetical protein DB31_6376 [Hyalangium minutum]|uniref:Uncharacterized protein n=1 Tax=Hyalangium minutum TaxID=394096 RepID=A0A085WNY8_9BACT|nr:hypothetical protein DB31_6376 [Hyalangium minutum]
MDERHRELRGVKRVRLVLDAAVQRAVHLLLRQLPPGHSESE